MRKTESKNKARRANGAMIILGGLIAAWPLLAEQRSPTTTADGALEIPSRILPFSSFSSEETRAAILDMNRRADSVSAPVGAMDVPGSAINRYREDMDAVVFRPVAERVKALYPVKVENLEIAGIKAARITPAEGVAPENNERILLNLHGGGFVLNGLVSAMVESIPVASLARIPVLTVDYRVGPEHKFPAASIDVAAVYSHLLKTYKPENIGIYGCSAGGYLTAQAVAWFQQKNLPRPGAIGLLCMGAGGFGEGDSWRLWPSGPSPAYLEQADPHDPLVSPLVSMKVLEKFPPTLVITSSRAFELSSAIQTDIQLTRAGVTSELHVWDGLSHGEFVYLVDTSEARDTAKMVSNFFQRHLGRGRSF